MTNERTDRVLDGGGDALERFRDGVDGSWGRGLAAHLARRGGFGMPPDLVRRLTEAGPEGAIAALFDGLEDSRSSRQLLETAKSTNSLETAQNWWIHQMLQGETPLKEKVALFWHGHFATSNRKVENARLMLDQIDLFRQRGMGPFGELVQRVSKDPAMLVWLDSNLNRAGKPNENFARELMELFTLGIGNYTEVDIKEAARAFTGWHVRGVSFWFNERAHDRGEKALLGHSGVRSGEQVVDLCVDENASSRFIASKLFKYFVHPRPAEALVDTLAAAYEAADRNVGAYLRRLLSSRLFYTREVRRTIISSPADYAIGTLRTLGGRAGPARIARHMRDMGQDLFQPPNVKGWDGGRTWINSTSIIARLRFCIELSGSLGERVPWDELGESASSGAFASVVERCFPEGIDAAISKRLRSSAGVDDAKRIAAAVMQLPEYQMI